MFEEHVYSFERQELNLGMLNQVIERFPNIVQQLGHAYTNCFLLIASDDE